jgi:predicted RNase H-like HicB family nuclease
MKYHFKIHKEKDGFWAECLELDGCATQADSKEDLFKNMQEALNLYLQEPPDSSYLAPLPKKRMTKIPNVVEVLVEPEIAFAFMVRYHRLTNNLTQKQAAKKLGFKNIYSYQRLEKKCNATLDMIGKLKRLFPSFSVDYAF